MYVKAHELSFVNNRYFINKTGIQIWRRHNKIPVFYLSFIYPRNKIKGYKTNYFPCEIHNN